jgi:hypothetical protein
MRLIQQSETGEFSLTKDYDANEIPPYAILSHTWGSDFEEVTFKDLVEGSGTSKVGYDKIRFCAQQAAKDGLKYCWVDTCCIDKSNNTALAEAIVSMFRWYRNAIKCYVYLSDVFSHFDQANPSIQRNVESTLQCSRWFSRGWTLQELIAPAVVEFYSCNGMRLGDKMSLERQIHQITGIPIHALKGGSLSDYSIDDRMAWVAKRETRRAEDMIYCLMGILGIYLPPLYGEGRDNALHRLRREINDVANRDSHLHSAPERDQCLRDLFVTDPREDKARIEKDKDTLLADCYTWILQDSNFQRWRTSDDSRLLWIKGDPGKGKTMMMIGLVNELSCMGQSRSSSLEHRSGQNLTSTNSSVISFFFCQSTRPELNNATAVLRGLIYLLVAQKEELIHHVRRKYKATGPQMFHGPNAIYGLQAILSDIINDPAISSTVLLVDALDECNTGLPELLDVVNSMHQNSKVKWLVTSRNLPNIEQHIGRRPETKEASHHH